MNNRQLWSRFIPYFKPYWRVMVLDLLCAALTTLCELVLPKIVQTITNGAMSTPIALTVELVLKMGGLYLVLRLIDTAAAYYMAYAGHIMGTKIETDMRTDLFDHLQKLSFSYYSDAKVGQLMARITSDLFDVTEFAHHCPEEFFIAGIKIIASFIILVGMNLPLTLVVFALLPLMFICTNYFNKQMRGAFSEQRNQVGEVNSQVEDSLLGMRVVKSFANEDLERERFHKGNMAFYNAKCRAYRYMAGFSSTTRMIDGIMYIVVVIVGALLLIGGKLDAGQYVAYILYISTLLTSIRRIVEFREQFQRGMTGIERFTQIIDEPVEIKDEDGAKELGSVRGEVVFDNVSFHYGDNEKQVLSNLALHVSEGQNIAIVGPSGGGKTTMCNLIPRFYDVSSGRILIDGKDIRGVTLKSLRSSIGVVQQEVYLFSGTIFDNIAYGKRGATREEVIEAAKRAGADEFISALVKGYDTYVGERGVKLSGGQKQRIAIARVFLKNPPILILDEATSALDNESEHLVQKSLEELTKGRTTFTVAHRLTTIRNADVIWVLTERGVEETGSHSELIAKGGIYAHLYSMYTEPRDVV
ncbi:MAG: ABC transporter ATP-binding protein [Eubacteriales bacterium]|nr:ABC transporter ATP-binding protein [Eubacteriales bacterium]MDD3881253.1 ABC transporter ATP-binding protein [Eubacteriales bacterium]MDD4512171.1 ABC transporter ATP-binding protein [Eubacteriales bacterium]